MDLREFVRLTLEQITEGVNDSGPRINELGGQVNPHIMNGGEEMATHGLLWGTGVTIQVVKFDVALTVNTGTGTKGGIGILAGAVNLGSSGESHTQNSSVSRVCFAVPLALPRPNAI